VTVSAEQLAWIADQLSELGPVTTRRMFGGAGLYFDGVMFGLVDDDVCYFKADDASRQDYVARGCAAFRPSPGKASMSYFAVPDDVLEDPTELAEWASRAVEAARAKKGTGTISRPRP